MSATKIDKIHKYRRLVEERRNCTKCEENGIEGITNPSKTQFDCEEINAWSQWQNSLSAKIVLVGQDWGTVKHFNENKGKDPSDPTNKILPSLFKLLDHKIDVPNGETYGRKDPDLFFTNVVLCLKQGQSMQGKLPRGSAKNCALTFTKPLIDIIQPRLVIALGQIAFESIAVSFGLKLSSHRLKDAVDKRDGFQLNKETRMFPVFHCGKLGVNINRPSKEQEKDWEKIKHYLESIDEVQ